MTAALSRFGLREMARISVAISALLIGLLLFGPRPYIWWTFLGLLALALLDSAGVVLQAERRLRVSIFLWGLIAWSIGAIAIAAVESSISGTLELTTGMWIGLLSILLLSGILALRTHMKQATPR